VTLVTVLLKSPQCGSFIFIRQRAPLCSAVNSVNSVKATRTRHRTAKSSWWKLFSVVYIDGITTTFSLPLLDSILNTRIPCLGSCSRFRMRRPGYSHELADENTSHQSWDNYTGYLSAVESTLSWHAVLMYRISRGLAPKSPTYTCKTRCRLASEVSSGRRLRSANVPTFVVPRTRTKLGDRRLWNSLPGPLRQFETLTTFKRQLKTFLFSD